MKKIKMTVCCLCLLVTCFLGALSFSASEYADLSGVNSRLQSVCGGNIESHSLKYIVVQADNGKTLLILGSDVAYSGSVQRGLCVYGYTCPKWGSMGAQIFEWTSSGWKNIATMSSPTYCGVLGDAMYQYFGYSTPSEWVACVNEGKYQILACSTDIKTDEGGVWFPTSDFGWNIVYNAQLGYVKNGEVRLLYLNGSDGKPDYNTGLYRISFDNESTTGLDLTSDEYNVRVFGRWACYKWSVSGWCEQKPEKDVPLVDIYSTGKLDRQPLCVEFVEEELTQSTYDTINVFTDFGVGGTILAQWIEDGSAVVCPIIYVQITKDTASGMEWGGFCAFEFSGMDRESGVAIYKCTTYNADMSVDSGNGGYKDSNVNSGVGSGSDYSDANNNASDNIVNGSMNIEAEDLLASIEGLTGLLGDFPKVIGALFSFLPDWCLVFFGSSFAVLVFLIIFKFLRG